MPIEVVTSLESAAPEVERLAALSPYGSFYHTGAWLGSLAAAHPRMKFRCLFARDSGRVKGALPFFVFGRGPLRAAWSLPFGTYGGPVAEDDDTCDELLASYQQQLSSLGVIEIGMVDFHNRMQSVAGLVEESETHIVDVSRGFDALWNEGFDRPRRRRTRRAEESGVVVERARNSEDTDAFFGIYRERLGQWGRRAGHPQALFTSLSERGGDAVRLYVARHKGEVVGGHLNFYYKDGVIAWYGMTSDRGSDLQAGTLLYTVCMRDACDEGYQTYNLGGSLGKESLIAYKQSLGGKSYHYRTIRIRSLLGRAAARVRRGGGRS